MNADFEETADNHSPAFSIFAYNLVEDILTNAHNPARMNLQLVEQLRELTGARLVVLVHHRETEEGGYVHELAAVEPARRRYLAESPAMMALAAMTRDLDDPTLWERGEALPEADARLEESLPGPAVAVPLRVGRKHVGALLLFGLPDKHSLDQVIDSLGTLSRVVALVLRNAALYEDQEATIAARTRELAASRERLEVTLRSIGDAVIATDIQGRVNFINPVAEALTGWEEPEALGRPLDEVFDIINEETRQPVENTVVRVASEGAVVGLANHTLLVARDGTERPIADSGAPIRDAQGEITGVVLVFRDQTEEREAQRALAESERRYRSVFNGVQDAILVGGMSGEILDVNTQACEMFGWSRAEFVTKTVADLVPEGHIAVIPDELPDSDFPTQPVETVNIRADGEHFPAEISTRLHRMDDDTVMLVVVRDITERKRAEEEVWIRARQQAAVAGLGQRALAGVELSALMDEAVSVVAETLDVEYCKVLELLPDGEALLLRAGVGWQAGLVGQATVSAGAESQAGYTLVSHEPVIVEDLSTETRFSGPPLLNDHGVVSGISVIIQGEGRPFGVMGAHTTSRRTFTQDDVHFLQAAANVLAEAIQRRRAEEALRESEEKYRRLFEHANDSIFIIDPATQRFLDVNENAARRLGYTREELLHLSLDAIYTPTAAARNEVIIRELQEAGSVVFEHAHRRKDGAEMPVEISSRVIEYGGRQVIQSFARDITDRKRAEAQQAHLHSLLKAMSDVNQLIVRARDPQAMLQEAVQILQRTRGYAGLWIGLLDEAGQRLRQVAGAGIAADVEPVDVSLDEPGPPLHCARTALAERRPYLVEDVGESHPCATCSYRATAPHAGALAVPLLHRQGCYGALVVYTERPWAFAEDETQLLSELANDLALGLYTLEAEEKLRQSEEKYRGLFNESVAAIYVVDAEKNFIDSNQAGLNLLGYSREELLSMSIPDVDADSAAMLPTHQQLLSGERIVNYEHQLKRKDGRIITVLNNSRPLTDAQGDVVGMQSTLIDMTERKRAEAALKEHSEQLEEMVAERTQELRDAQEKLLRQERLAALGELAGGVGHELRNPLGVITNAVYYLNMVMSDADAKTQEYLQLIDAEAKNAAKIVSDLLDYARIKSIDRSPAKVSELVDAVISQHPAPEGVALEMDVPEDLPPVFVDPNQIKQVLTNLVTNAYQAMPEGGRLTIENCELSISNSDTPMVALCVRDTGTGMAPETMGKIFEPLFTTKAKGIGLGLAISKKLVEANRGRIEVDSEYGTGTTFTLSLPVYKDKS